MLNSLVFGPDSLEIRDIEEKSERKDRKGRKVRRNFTRSVIERRSGNVNNDLFRIGHS